MFSATAHKRNFEQVLQVTFYAKSKTHSKPFSDGLSTAASSGTADLDAWRNERPLSALHVEMCMAQHL
jgi:hypothetical protein